MLKFFLFLCFIPGILFSRDYKQYSTKYGKILIEQFASAPFPHPQREKGYSLTHKTYPAKEHYSDQSSIIYIPNGIENSSAINMVFYFHGWNDKLVYIPPTYKIISQFAASHKNAILVIPQGPKLAPDSFWGHFEKKEGFKKYVNEVIGKLYRKKKITTDRIGKLVLAGHGASYRVIGYILMRGEMSRKIQEVYLFDGLYGELEKYIYWFTFYGGRFASVFTQRKDVLRTNMRLIEDLDGWKVAYLFKKEKDMQEKELLENRLVFILSQRPAAKIMHNNFYYLLKTGSLPDL